MSVKLGYGYDGLLQTVKVIANSVSFILMVVLALYAFEFNPLYGVALVFSAFDQVEDVYGVVTGKALLPRWFRWVDIVGEGIVLIIGLLMFVFGITYWYVFSSYFFAVWTVVSFMMVYTAASDIYDDFHFLSSRVSGINPLGMRIRARKGRYFGKVR